MSFNFLGFLFKEEKKSRKKLPISRLKPRIWKGLKCSKIGCAGEL